MYGNLDWSVNVYRAGLSASAELFVTVCCVMRKVQIQFDFNFDSTGVRLFIEDY